jgi:hypothetical protein
MQLNERASLAMKAYPLTLRGQSVRLESLAISGRPGAKSLALDSDSVTNAVTLSK